jgi:hypothetical protein
MVLMAWPLASSWISSVRVARSKYYWRRDRVLLLLRNCLGPSSHQAHGLLSALNCLDNRVCPYAGSVSGFGDERIASPKQLLDATGSHFGRTATPLRRVERRPASAGVRASL